MLVYFETIPKPKDRAYRNQNQNRDWNCCLIKYLVLSSKELIVVKSEYLWPKSCEFELKIKKRWPKKIYIFVKNEKKKKFNFCIQFRFLVRFWTEISAETERFNNTIEIPAYLTWLIFLLESNILHGFFKHSCWESPM